MAVNEVRRYMEAAVGKLSPKKAQELAKSLTKGQGKEQVTKAAQDLMAWSNKNRERLGELVRTEVRSQLKQLGVASRDEVESLRRRVRDLEKAQKAAARPAAKRTTAKSRAKATTTAKAMTTRAATKPTGTGAAADASSPA
ncbi:MAG TPA: phasin family protein [Actinomycetota bacterium]|nr:phasin family protein [Actinomycetota bacterium]